MKRSSALPAYLIIVAVIVTLDLWSKHVVFDFLGAEIIPQPAGPPFLSVNASQLLVRDHEYEIIPAFFSLQAALNPGAFYGWFSGMRWLLLTVSAGWAIGTLAYLLTRPSCARYLVIALALTAGGALGNLYDRYYIAAVRDFLKFDLPLYGTWPNFNVADSCICIGVALLLLREFLTARAPKPAPVDVINAPVESATTNTAESSRLE